MLLYFTFVACHCFHLLHAVFVLQLKVTSSPLSQVSLPVCLLIFQAVPFLCLDGAVLKNLPAFLSRFTLQNYTPLNLTWISQSWILASVFYSATCLSLLCHDLELFPWQIFNKNHNLYWAAHWQHYTIPSKRIRINCWACLALLVRFLEALQRLYIQLR